jgi:hypothetical protein
MMFCRRAHLYLGLLLFPWAILYGVTGFLFNHPTAFSDQQATNFGREATAGTALDYLISPERIADDLIAKLNDVQKPATPYELAGPAKFNREFAFAQVKAEAGNVSLLFDPKAGTGTIRRQPVREKVEKVEPPKAPFATNREARPAREPRQRGGAAPAPRPASDGIMLADPLQDRLKAAIPTILERSGFPAEGEVTVTSVPEVVVPIRADGRIWTATYNPMTGSVSGKAADTKPESELGWRRFLLRLHTAHGYPGETNSRWAWAVIVDVMAFVMCFWGLSGLIMWWQLKQQRTLGYVLLTLSAIAATALGMGMHSAMAG